MGTKAALKNIKITKINQSNAFPTARGNISEKQLRKRNLQALGVLKQ